MDNLCVFELAEGDEAAIEYSRENGERKACTLLVHTPIVRERVGRQGRGKRAEKNRGTSVGTFGVKRGRSSQETPKDIIECLKACQPPPTTPTTPRPSPHAAMPCDAAIGGFLQLSHTLAAGSQSHGLEAFHPLRT